MSLQCGDGLAAGVPSLAAQIICAGAPPLPCSPQISFAELIRPVTVTTAQFGATWKTVPHEVKRSLVCRCHHLALSSPALVARLSCLFVDKFNCFKFGLGHWRIGSDVHRFYERCAGTS